ncbi:LOW QUALITY PROTEIN: hypothetical protein PHPALM_29029 [Phytophthora palmivora]|uniref:Uncharacterized protein n=1 Tax=Phytophthora palmivora TaxID=4796 RepID=A0A2P4X8L9_9STRA|nr:LOW QUALITY PROTEIN: hypothetical protein PHPALM_29029 [Phytophthora palmivora]
MNIQANTNTLKQLVAKPLLNRILHPNTPELPALSPNVGFDIKSSSDFPQHNRKEPGVHYRIEDTGLLTQPGIRDKHSVLIICVFNGAESWGENLVSND